MENTSFCFNAKNYNNIIWAYNVLKDLNMMTSISKEAVTNNSFKWDEKKLKINHDGKVFLNNTLVRQLLNLQKTLAEIMDEIYQEQGSAIFSSADSELINLFSTEDFFFKSNSNELFHKMNLREPFCSSLFLTKSFSGANIPKIGFDNSLDNAIVVTLSLQSLDNKKKTTVNSSSAGEFLDNRTSTKKALAEALTQCLENLRLLRNYVEADYYENSNTGTSIHNPTHKPNFEYRTNEAVNMKSKGIKYIVMSSSQQSLDSTLSQHSQIEESQTKKSKSNENILNEDSSSSSILIEHDDESDEVIICIEGVEDTEEVKIIIGKSSNCENSYKITTRNSVEHHEDPPGINVIFNPDDPSKSIVLGIASATIIDKYPQKQSKPQNKIYYDSGSLWKLEKTERIKKQTDTNKKCSFLEPLYPTKGFKSVGTFINQVKLSKDQKLLKLVEAKTSPASCSTKIDLKQTTKLRFTTEDGQDMAISIKVSPEEEKWYHNRSETQCFLFTRSKVCSSIEFDINFMDISLKETDNPLKQTTKKCNPYAISLGCLPLEDMDLNIVQENNERSNNNCLWNKDAAYYLSLDDLNLKPWVIHYTFQVYYFEVSCSHQIKNAKKSETNKLHFYINLIKDVPHLPSQKQVFDIRFFEIQKFNKNYKASSTDASVSSGFSLLTSTSDSKIVDNDNTTKTKSPSSAPKDISNIEFKKLQDKLFGVRPKCFDAGQCTKDIDKKIAIQNKSLKSKSTKPEVYSISEKSLPCNDKGSFYSQVYAQYLKEKQLQKPGGSKKKTKDVGCCFFDKSSKEKSMSDLYLLKLMHTFDNEFHKQKTSKNWENRSKYTDPETNKVFKASLDKYLRENNSSRESSLRPNFTRRKKPQYYMARSKSDINLKSTEARNVKLDGLQEIYGKRKNIFVAKRETPSTAVLKYFNKIVNSEVDSGNTENEGDFVHNDQLDQNKRERKRKFLISARKKLSNFSSQPNVEAGMEFDSIYNGSLITHLNAVLAKDIQTDSGFSQSEASQTCTLETSYTKSCQYLHRGYYDGLMDIMEEQCYPHINDQKIYEISHDFEYSYSDSCDDVFDNCVFFIDDLISPTSDYISCETENNLQDFSETVSMTFFRIKQLLANQCGIDQVELIESLETLPEMNNDYFIYQSTCPHNPSIFQRLLQRARGTSKCHKCCEAQQASPSITTCFKKSRGLFGCSPSCDFNHVCEKCGYYVPSGYCNTSAFTKFCKCLSRHSFIINVATNQNYRRACVSDVKKTGPFSAFSNKSTPNCCCGGKEMNRKQKCGVCPDYLPCTCRRNPKNCSFSRIDLCLCGSKKRNVIIQCEPETDEKGANTHAMAKKQKATQMMEVDAEHEAQTLTVCACKKCHEDHTGTRGYEDVLKKIGSTAELFAEDDFNEAAEVKEAENDDIAGPSKKSAIKHKHEHKHEPENDLENEHKPEPNLEHKHEPDLEHKHEHEKIKKADVVFCKLAQDNAFNLKCKSRGVVTPDVVALTKVNLFRDGSRDINVVDVDPISINYLFKNKNAMYLIKKK